MNLSGGKAGISGAGATMGITDINTKTSNEVSGIVQTSTYDETKTAQENLTELLNSDTVNVGGDIVDNTEKEDYSMTDADFDGTLTVPVELLTKEGRDRVEDAVNDLGANLGKIGSDLGGLVEPIIDKTAKVINKLLGKDKVTFTFGEGQFTYLTDELDYPNSGVVSTNWHKDGDVLYAGSTSDLWSDIPDEYQGEYTASDLIERYNAKKDEGAKYKSILEQESLGLSRKDQIWNNKDYSNYLYDKYGSNSALIIAYDTKLINEMIPSPSLSDMFKGIRNFGIRQSVRKLKKFNPNFVPKPKTSNNSWILFLQKNKGKYKGLGKNWINTAVKDYNKLKSKK